MDEERSRAVPVRFDPSQEPGVIRLEGDVDIASAAALKAVLVEALAAHRETRIALATATGLDVTAIQLLWAAEREAQAAGMSLTVEGPVPEGLRATLREAGFAGFPCAGDGEGAKEAR